MANLSFDIGNRKQANLSPYPTCPTCGYDMMVITVAPAAFLEKAMKTSATHMRSAHASSKAQGQTKR